MQIAACYIRVSTEDQTEYSPDAQLSAIKDFAGKNNLLLDETYIFKDEGISGRKADKRPGFQGMITAAKTKPRPFDVILIHKFDRFARNREDSIVYKSLLRKECGIQIISVTEPLSDDKMSILMESLLEAMAEYYSLNLADEVQKGKIEKTKRGEYSGRPPYGYKLENGKLTIHEETASVVRTIFDMFQTANCSKITHFLNESGITPRRGGQWYDNSITYILQNPVYAGHIRYNYRDKYGTTHIKPESEHIYVFNTHEPIVSQELFDKTQERLKIFFYSQPKYFHTGEVRHWLQRLLYCADCGRMMTTNTTRGKPRFVCSGIRYKKCSSVSMMAYLVEETIIPVLRKDFAGMYTIMKKTEPKRNESEIKLLHTELARIDNQLERAQAAYIAGIDTIQEYKRLKDNLQNKKDSIIKNISLLPVYEKKRISQEQFETVLDILENPGINQNRKNEAAKSIIDKITVDLRNKDIKILYR